MMRLTDDMREILEAVIARRNPELSGAVQVILKAGPTKDVDVTDHEVGEICSELADELCENGLDVHDRPNEKGVVLYDLISYVNQFLET